MALEPDIVDRVRRDFGGESEQALVLLRESGKTGRVARCIVVASRGSLADPSALDAFVELAAARAAQDEMHRSVRRA